MPLKTNLIRFEQFVENVSNIRIVIWFIAEICSPPELLTLNKSHASGKDLGQLLFCGFVFAQSVDLNGTHLFVLSEQFVWTLAIGLQN